MKIVEQKTRTNESIRCSFCDASSDDKFYMITRTETNVRICNQCIDEAYEQLYYARVLAAHTHQDLMH